MKTKSRPKCDYCGRFVKLEACSSEFTPDSHFGPERIEYLCELCAEAEITRKLDLLRHVST